MGLAETLGGHYEECFSYISVELCLIVLGGLPALLFIYYYIDVVFFLLNRDDKKGKIPSKRKKKKTEKRKWKIRE